MAPSKLVLLNQRVAIDLRRTWKSGTVHLTVANWLSRGAALGQRIFLARILGPQNIGHIGVANSVLALIQLPAGAGTFNVVTKLVAEDTGNHQKQREILGTAIWINCGTTLIVGFAAWAFLRYTQWLGDPIAQNLLRILLFLLPVMIFNQVFQCALIGERRIKAAANLKVMAAILSVGAVIPMAWIWSLVGWLYNQFLVVLFSFAILLWLLRRILSLHWNTDVAKKVASIGGFAFAGQLLGTLIYQVDTLTVSGILKDPTSTGIYNTAALVAQQMVALPGAVLQISFPFFAQNRNDFQKIRARYNELFRKLCCLVLGMSACLWLLSPWIFPIFGPDFSASIPVFRILAIGAVARCLYILDNTYLDALGRTDITFLTGLLSASIAILLNFIFISRWNLMGAAWATTLSMFISLALRQFAVQYFIFYKRAIR